MRLQASHDFVPAGAPVGQAGRWQLPGFLSQKSADRVREAAQTVPRWALVTRLGGKPINLDAAAMEALPQVQRAEFDRRVAAEASSGFQYLYETFAIYDKWHGGVLRAESPILADLFEFLNGDRFLDLMRDFLKAPDIGFCDAQLTRYRAGHFLSRHDDAVPGKNRVAAYVLSLSEGWSPDHGGCLRFVGDGGDVEAVFPPRFNTLSLFRVPQAHEVTPVKAGVTGHRLSITGWLRRGTDPGP